MKKLLFCLLALTAYTVVNCSDDKGLIEINGQKDSMIGHILKAESDAWAGKTDHPLSNTDIFTHGAKGFTKVGTVLKATYAPTDTLQEIGQNNYVYTPFYTRKESDSGLYEDFGAIIVGTKDQSLADKLHFTMMKP